MLTKVIGSAVLILSSILLSTFSPPSQTAEDPQRLSPGQQLERQVAGSETGIFQIELKKGEYARVVVEQQNADVFVSLFSPDGKLAAGMGGRGPEVWRVVVSAVAREDGGIFRVEVEARAGIDAPGKYRIKLAELHSAEVSDGKRVEAERRFGAGRKFYEQGNAASLEKAAVELEAAASLWRESGDRAWEAVALLNLGWAYSSPSKRELAIASHSKAAEMFHQVQDQKGEALAVNGLANTYQRAGRYDEARESYERALSLTREGKDIRGEGSVLSNLGFLHQTLGQNEKARDYFERALAIARTTRDRGSEASRLMGLGNVYSNMDQQEKARGYYEQALKLRREMKDRRGEGRALIGLGNVQSNLGNIEEAGQYFEQALVIAKETKDPSGEVVILNNLAGLYTRQHLYERALGYHEQALPIRRELRDRRGEGETLTRIGLIYLNLSRYERARDYFEQGLAAKRETGDRDGESATLHDLGNVYNSLGQPEKAQGYYEQALAISRETKDRRGAARTLIGLGNVNVNLYRYEKARSYYEEALPLLRELKDRSAEGATLDNLGIITFRLAEPLKSVEYFEQALTIARELNERRSEGDSLNKLATAYDSVGQHEKARAAYERALLFVKEGKDRRLESSIYSNLAVSWQKSHNPKMATFYGKQAINAFQEIRGNNAGLTQEARRSLLKTFENTYRRTAELLIAQDRLAEGHQILNSFQDQQFFDFDQSEIKQPSPLSLTPREAELDKRFADASERVGHLASQLEKLRRQVGNRRPVEQEAAQLGELESGLNAATNGFLTLLSDAAKEFAQPLDGRDQIGDLKDTREMQTALTELTAATGQKAAVLYTLVGGDELHILLITVDGEVKHYKSPVRADDLNKKILQFYALLQSPTYDPRPLGKELYDIVLRPAEAELKKVRAQTLMWSLDGSLRYVPMAALFDGQKYLIERFQNVVFTRADTERMTRAVSQSWTGTGLGSSRAHTVTLPGEASGINFQPLPGVIAELQSIFRTGAKDEGILNGAVFLDEVFTRDSFYEAMKQRRPLVHISSHFSFRPGDESRTFLLLGDGTTLSLSEMKKPSKVFDGVELLTLSACNTAATLPDAEGKEIDGFAELAQRLGAGSVMATLWQVSDDSTPWLMKEFYATRQSRRNTTKASALRNAQLALVKGTAATRLFPGMRQGGGTSNVRLVVVPDASSETSRLTRADIVYVSKIDAPLFKHNQRKRFAHPYYWSPFVLYGNWR